MKDKFHYIGKLILKFGWQRVVLISLIVVGLLPSLFVEWMIIDDGVSILHAQKISELLSNFDLRGLHNLFLESGGRYRPMYWIYYWAVSLITGESVVGHRIIHAVVVGLSVYTLFLIIRQLTSSKTVALIGSSLFFLTPLNIENWYRVGTPEPMYTLYLGISTYLLLKVSTAKKSLNTRKIYLAISVFVLAIAFFTKETFVAFLPFAVLLFLGRFWIKNKIERKVWSRNTLFFVLATLILTATALLTSMFIKTQGDYSSNYSFSLLSSVDAARGYMVGIWQSFGIFPRILLVSSIIFYVKSIIRREFSFKSYLQLAFLFGGICFLAVLLPWSFVIGRYLEPAIFLLIAAFSFEIDRILSYVQKFSRLVIHLSILNKESRLNYPVQPLVITIVIIFYLSFVYNHTSTMFNYVSDTILGSRMIARTLQVVSTEAGQGSTVFMNLKKGDATLELVFEGGLHLNLFHNRPDLKVEYLDEKSMVNLKEGDIIVSAFTGNSMVKYRDELFQKDKRLERVWLDYHRVPSLTLISPPIGAVMRSTFFGKPLETKNLFKYSTSENMWKIYKTI